VLLNNQPDQILDLVGANFVFAGWNLGQRHRSIRIRLPNERTVAINEKCLIVFIRKVVDTEFSIFGVLPGRVGAAPNQVVAVEVLQPETETSEAEQG
jgi:hypothetical protein